MKKEYAAGRNCKVYDGAILFPNVTLGDNVTIFPGAVIGRPPLSSGATARKVRAAKLLPVKIGDNSVVGANAVIYMGVKIGKRAMICDGSLIREGCSVGDRTLIGGGVTINYNSKIGDRVKIMDNTHITGNMTVEDDVFISILVTTTNDNSLGRKTPTGEDWTDRGPIIRRGAAIGQAAALLPGIEVGENAIVGASAVVTKNVPPQTLVLGIPARVVRQLRKDELKPPASTPSQ